MLHVDDREEKNYWIYKTVSGTLGDKYEVFSNSWFGAEILSVRAIATPENPVVRMYSVSGYLGEKEQRCMIREVDTKSKKMKTIYHIKFKSR